MLFQHTPTVFNRMVFALLRRRRRETDGELGLVRTCQQTLQELGAPTVVLWAVIDSDEQRLAVGKAFLHALPPLHQPISPTLAGHF